MQPQQTPWRFLRLIVPAMALILGACISRPMEKPKLEPARESCKTQPLFLDKDVDMLFVIDNSNSMDEEQKLLRKNFPMLIDALKTSKLGGKIPNVRIGVVSIDLGAGNYNLPSCETPGGDQGRLWNKPQISGCTPPKDKWISYTEGKTNIPGAGDPIKKVKDAFSCIANIGVNGCGFEMPLESARRALANNAGPNGQPINPGFLRNNPKNNEDALLAVVIITDEDDCSASNPQLFDPSQQGLTDPLGPLTSYRCFEFGITCKCNGGKCARTTQGPRKNCVPGGTYLYKVENYIKFFQNIKKTADGTPNPKRVIMAAIAGPTAPVAVGMDGVNPVLKPSCQGAGGTAVPGIRIKAVVHAFARELTTKEIADIKAKQVSIPYWVDKSGKWREENFTSICTSDFSPALKRLAGRIVGALGTLCLNPPALTDNGGILCKKGDVIYTDKITGKKITCKKSCLEKAKFTIQEVTTAGRSTINPCPDALFDSVKYNKKACGDHCPCWRIVPSKVCKNIKGSSPYSVEIMRKTEAAKGTFASVCALTSSNYWGTKGFAGLPQCN